MDLNTESQLDINTVSAEEALPRVNAKAKYPIGNQVKHRIFGFRGVIFDVDPVFSNSDAAQESLFAPVDCRNIKFVTLGFKNIFHLISRNRFVLIK